MSEPPVGVPHEDDQALERDDGSTCFWCEVPLSEDGRCPECGRRQTRICFCGKELRPGEETCPACGADSVGVLKVRRKRRRSSVHKGDLLGYVAAGFLGFVFLGALFISIVGGLAARSAGDRPLPASLTERVALAWQTVRTWYANIGLLANGRLGDLMPIVGIGLLGALVGAAFYLIREGRLTLRRSPSTLPSVIKRRRRA